MNHRTSNGRLWLLTGWRAWVVAFGTVIVSAGIIFTAFTRIYPLSPFGVLDRLAKEEQAREALEARVAQSASDMRDVKDIVTLDLIARYSPKGSKVARDADEALRWKLFNGPQVPSHR